MKLVNTIPVQQQTRKPSKAGHDEELRIMAANQQKHNGSFTHAALHGEHLEMAEPRAGACAKLC